MQTFDVLIVGAGAAGLIAAREIALAGKRVAILEARDRPGGRIHTIRGNGFPFPVEAGAEFVHGDLPLTLQLFEEAGIARTEAGGRTWQVREGKWQPGEMFDEAWELLLDRLRELKEDCSIESFMERHFADEAYAGLRRSVRRYAEGYDAADPRRASALALREEWLSEDEAPQYRPGRGYGELIEYLAGQVVAAGGVLITRRVVNAVHWQAGRVAVWTGQQRYEARQIILTIPLGVWQAPAGALGTIAFSPALPEKLAAAQRMGFGGVIKFLLAFREAFWAKEDLARPMPGLGFLFTDAAVPTWWTQTPEEKPLLTGWLAGPSAARYPAKHKTELLEMALDALAYACRVEKSYLKEQLVAQEVVDWLTDPFARGAYTYAAVGDSDARETLGAPVANTLYFAGEALYEGAEMGTVEAALQSGRKVARQLLVATPARH